MIKIYSLNLFTENENDLNTFFNNFSKNNLTIDDEYYNKTNKSSIPTNINPGKKTYNKKVSNIDNNDFNEKNSNIKIKDYNTNNSNIDIRDYNQNNSNINNKNYNERNPNITNKYYFEKNFENPIDMIEIISTIIDNNEKFNINIWISFDNNIYINITEYNLDKIIRYLFERYPY